MPRRLCPPRSGGTATHGATSRLSISPVGAIASPASTVDGSTYRFKMVVAEECVFDRLEAPHAMELFTLHNKYADVVPVDDVLQYLSRIEER